MTELGATVSREGTGFAVHASQAERVELCLFDEQGRETGRYDLARGSDGVWHGFMNGIGAGQQYGYRAHGEFAPERGLRHNPAKLLIDPYARALSGRFEWTPAVFDYRIEELDGKRRRLLPQASDSAPDVPKSVVTDELPTVVSGRERPNWCDLVIYEANVRGYTMRHPEVPEADRGRFRGLANGRIIEYLKALGINSIELQPVCAFLDEQFLAAKGLRNYWGYNTIGFFAPAARYAGDDPRREFRSMVEALHDAGIEVILDVVYNHTAEGGAGGPTLSFRGLDNLAYYRTDPEDRSVYVNDTGTGNTMNADSAPVQRLILDSLRYWAGTMGVDGFRFDLAPVLGRSADGFRPDHPLLTAISNDPLLRGRRMIAEPWDPGPGGYQLGNFPEAWAEWNDRFRDSVRRFWRGDDGEAAEFARRLHGSADIFEGKGRGPCASVNFVTAHDGFTLADTVSYAERHNEANGEQNRDGHAHNYSANYGVEGPTNDESVNRIRRQQRLNMLATLLLSQGTPMLLAGDEIGNSQLGNNNVYAQDNDTAWIDWSNRDADPEFFAAVRALIELRREIPLFRQPSYVHGRSVNAVGWGEIEWLNAEGKAMSAKEWEAAKSLGVVLAHSDEAGNGQSPAVVLLLNAARTIRRFTLPSRRGNTESWSIRFVSAAEGFRPLSNNRFELPARCIVCVSLDRR